MRGSRLIAAAALAFNTFFVFMPNHLVAAGDRAPASALLAAFIGLLDATAAALSMGALSDRLGRRPVVLGSVAARVSISMLAEVFPTTVRGTGLGLTAGLATAIAGGTAPLVDQVLYLATGHELAPAALWSWPETAFRDLV